MKKRIWLLLTLGALMALVLALSVGTASAQQQGDCTFQGGRTTCIVEEPIEPLVTTQQCQFNQGGQRTGEQTVTQERVQRTTSVFLGNSGNLDTRVSPNPKVEIINVGEPVLGPCRNVPGPQ
jgi:hypothetical protein